MDMFVNFNVNLHIVGKWLWSFSFCFYLLGPGNIAAITTQVRILAYIFNLKII